MTNGNLLLVAPWIRSIAIQSPPIPASWGLGGRFQTNGRPLYQRHGVLDYHTPCVLRARYRLWRQQDDLSTSEVTLVEAFRAMNEVRPFRLMFLFDAKNFFQEEARQESGGAPV